MGEISFINYSLSYSRITYEFPFSFWRNCDQFLFHLELLFAVVIKLYLKSKRARRISTKCVFELKCNVLNASYRQNLSERIRKYPCSYNPFKILIFISQNATSIVSIPRNLLKANSNGHNSLYKFLYLKCPFLLERMFL